MKYIVQKNSKKPLSSLIIFVLLASAFLGLTSFPVVNATVTSGTLTPLFLDSFEGVTYTSNWDDSASGTSTNDVIEISAFVAHNGTQSLHLKVEGDGVENGQTVLSNATYDPAISTNYVWFSAWVYFVSIDVPDTLFKSAPDISAFDIYSNNTWFWKGGISGAGTYIPVQLGSWIHIEEEYFIDPVNGYVKAYVNDVLIDSVTNIDTSFAVSLLAVAGGPMNIVFSSNSTAGLVNELYLDDFGYYEYTPDTTVPTFSGVSTNSTIVGASCSFNATFNDNLGLSANGQYIFETNNTGAWVADTPVNFSSSPQSVSVSKTLNSVVGATVSYRWNFTDNAGNFETTGIQNIVYLAAPPYVSSSYEFGGYVERDTNATFTDGSTVACKFTTPNVRTIDTARFLIASPDGMAVNATAVIYNHNGTAPYSLIALSNELTGIDNTVPQWWNFSFPANTVLSSATSYWFGLAFGGGDLIFFYEAGTTNQTAFNNGTWSEPPDPSNPFSDPQFLDYNLGVRVLYTPMSGGGGGGGSGNNGSPSPNPSSTPGETSPIFNDISEKIAELLSKIPPWLIWVIIAILLIAGMAGVLKSNKRGRKTPSRSFTPDLRGM